MSYAVDDNDLDDAELWAVIDSAAAAVHSSATRSRKPAAHRTPIFTPPAPAAGFYSNPRKRLAAAAAPDDDARTCSDGEVLEDEPWRPSPPLKQSRSYVGREFSENQIVVHRRGGGSGPPTTPMAAAAPASYSTPVCNNFVSPVAETPTVHSLSGRFPSVNLFKQYQNAAMAILERTDYTLIHGQPFIKKSGWRKISFYFNLSFEIKDKTIEFDENRNVQRAEFIVRAYMQGGRFSDGWGSCERREKRFSKPNHDIPSIAETRAKNKACQDLLGIGEYRHGSGDGSR